MVGTISEAGIDKSLNSRVDRRDMPSTNGRPQKTDRRDAKPSKGGYAATNRQWWAPRVWIGSDFFALFQLLKRNHFDLGFKHIHVALIDLMVSAVHTMLRLVQHVTHGRRIEATSIDRPPLFIIGHWRSGTTLLHELLVLDDQHTFPTTYECFCPHHVLLTEGVASKLLKFLVPPKRPMDNMALGWDRPQEDEFALCNLGIPSPYRTIAFPNRPPQNSEYLDLEGISADELARWKRTLLWFLKMLTYKDPRRLILKSPPHTSRIKVLLEMFPDARFVYMVRNPYVVFPSTVHLWKSLYQTHSFQEPTFDGLEEYVLDNFARMHEQFEATRDQIPPENLTVLRYEDLVSNPIENMRDIYDQLRLGDFEAVLPGIEQYFDDAADYQTNRYRKLSPEIRQQIAERWGPFIEQYGYRDPESVRSMSLSS